MRARQAELVGVVGVGEGAVAVGGDVGRELVLDGRQDDFGFHGGEGVVGEEEDGDVGCCLGD